MNKTKAKRKILQELNSFDSYEDMNEFLTEATVGTSKMLISDIIGQIPGFDKELNTMMLEKVVTQYGNPDDPSFTFSRKVSNERLLELISGAEKAEGKLTDLYGPAGEDRDNKIKELEGIMHQRNTEKKNADIKVTNLQEAVAAKRAEFDKRAKMYSPESPFGKIPFLGPVLPFFGKYMTQATAGWTDLGWFRDKGLEQIENRDWNWDPKYKRIGTSGTGIQTTQANLKEAYRDRKTIKPRYLEKSDEYENYKQIVQAKDALDGMFNETGADEALNHISLEQLTKILESQ